MNEYYRNKQTRVRYRMWYKSETEILVFKLYTDYYFEGSWSSEQKEKYIGTFSNKNDAYAKMLHNETI